MQIETWIGVAALFSGLALTASVATLIYTQSLLKRCKDILNFVLFTDEEMLIHKVKQQLEQEQEIEHAELTD